MKCVLSEEREKKRGERREEERKGRGGKKRGRREGRGRGREGRREGGGEEGGEKGGRRKGREGKKRKGREKRKAHNSAEGFLGVEGADIKILYEMLSPFATDSESSSMGCNITKLDFYNDGLTGKDNSKENRNKVARYLGLPADMTPNALLSAIQVAYTLDEYKSAVEKLIGD